RERAVCTGWWRQRVDVMIRALNRDSDAATRSVAGSGDDHRLAERVLLVVGCDSHAVGKRRCVDAHLGTARVESCGSQLNGDRRILITPSRVQRVLIAG